MPSRVGKLSLDGYRSTRTLRDSGRTRVYAAVRERDQRPVVVKLHEFDADEGVEVRVEHDFRMIQGLELDGAVDVLALERSGGSLAVVLDWCEGVNLDEYCGGQPVALGDFMTIALQVSRTLAEVHRYKVIHRNLKPTNIFIDPHTRVVSISDFGISALLDAERRRIDDPWVIEGSLPYVSPEQTGRTHHEVDFRSDLYSLGVTFYELLTGRRPFEGTTPLELIHAHLARRPREPQWLRPELPTVLSAIVMKLVEKAPERRYQSARGLHADLERVASALAAGESLEGFALGVNDVPAVLQLPHRLYGRSREVEALSQAFRAAGQGQPQFVLVSGATGVGKTALVNELAEPVMSRHGYFARGKFEREQTDKPYAGVFAAFSHLADQLLTQSDEQLELWSERLRERLGPSAGVLFELVPTLRPILGSVALAPSVGPLESRNRLAVACAALISEFARAEHPLLLSLDDFQWADAGTCELIAATLVEPNAALLVVATLREDELAPDSPAQELLDLIEARPGPSSHIALGPLADDDVAALIADTLAWPIEHIRSLAEIVGRNTNRNPFFVGQYLSHLVELGLLRPTNVGWGWDAEGIEAAGLPEDLLTMMTAKLGLLSAPQRELLTGAAVIGTRFDVAMLTALVGAETIDAALVALTREGLLTTLRGGRYGFTHDRIRDAAYAMNSPARSADLHRIVGEKCLERSGLGEIEESILEVVDHLNMGYSLVPIGDEDPAVVRARAKRALDGVDENQLDMLAELNALAGHNALIGAAPRAAVRYFEAGIQLVVGVQEHGSVDELPPRRVNYLNHELRFSLELGRGQALGLAGDRDQAERQFERLLQAPLDFARVGRAVAGRVEIRIFASDRHGAIECGLDGLQRLGVDPLAQEGGPEQFPLNRLVPMLRSAELRGLGETSTIRDARLEAALEILNVLIPVSHLVDPELHVALVTEHTGIMLAHGRHQSAPIALSYAAMFVGTAVGQRQLALEVVEIARALASHEGPGLNRQRIEPPYWVVASWVRPYAEGLAPLRESVDLALEAGDLEVAGYATDMVVTMSLSAGLHVEALERVADGASRRLRQWQVGPLVSRVEAYLDFTRELLAGDEVALRFDDDLVDIETRLEHRPTQYIVRMLRGMQRCLFGRWDEAYAELSAMDDFQRVVSGAWLLCDHALFYGLSAAALRPSVEDEDEREAMVWIVRLCLELLEGAAELAPANCVPRAALLEAEVHAAEGNAIEALAAFTKASRSAKDSQLRWLEALAFERSSTFLRRIGLDELAAGAMRDARASYDRWGAYSKVAQIDRRWPDLIDDASVNRPRAAITAGLALSASRALDLASILKASQAIAGDIELPDVVDRVMAIALENAGAERGALVLPGGSGLELTAICTAGDSGERGDEGEQGSTGFLREPVIVERASDRVPVSILRWVERTREPAILHDATTDMRFAADRYISSNGVRSVMCLPILKHDRLIALLYLENKLSSGSFNADRVEILDLLMAQAASALQNAQLFDALRGSEVRWRSLVEGLPDVVMLLDREGRVEFVNHFEGDDERHGVVGTPVDALVDEQDSDALHGQIARTIREVCQTELELRATLRSPEPRWYALRLAPIAVDGRVERVIAVATDITERREAARAKEHLEAQVRQQQRLESIGTLASGVAHEINNPVQGIMNYAELIGRMPDINEDAREFAGEIGYESQRVAAIVRSLLSFSRGESEDAAAVADIADIIEGTLLLVRTVIGKDQIELNVDTPDERILVMCRAQQIRQVIMNLVTNARDALCARWPEYHPDKRIDIEVRSFRPGDGDARWVRISVCDHGGGVPREAVGRIFDPFFTTKGRDQGTGLGLSVSHGIVSEHGGELHLENLPGVGARFHVELPLEAAS
ncbi:Sensor protein FixL [Enhygromyxa salina]|uniref:histidine kinase n=1 Tax=Enhygromyxa salina TaxID=215803 RepID=A0A2S9Y4J0_9BACT|nr:AAA family ATPase [Enhygromyxa salina]PRQ00020.1 Sensor protein FixL [Enhygromyxa salina]